MSETKSITRFVAKRTYLTGFFKGKYIGVLDIAKSDIDHDAFYNIEVLEGEVKTTHDKFTKWQTGGEVESFTQVEKFLTKLPSPIPCEITFSDGNVRHFKLDLKEPKLANYKLYNQVHEKDTVFGTIEGDISGYLLHYIPEEASIIDDSVNSIDSGSETDNNSLDEEETLTNITTGKPEVRGNYRRTKIYRTNGETQWGSWIYNKPANEKFSFWSLFSTFFSWLLIPLFFIPLLLLGGRVLVPILIISIVSFLFNFFKPFVSALFGLFSRFIVAALFFGFVVGLINLFRLSKDYKDKVLSKDEVSETTVIEKDPVLPNDSLISHHRIWNDYNEKQYEADIKIRYSDYKNSGIARTQTGLVVNSTRDYENLVNQISNFDRNKLDLFYRELDSIRVKNNLDQNQFAEVIISCIQDIPYTLILDQDCNPKLYNDEFINRYLETGGKCQGDVKYGFYTPVEFLSTLDGDCDTRSLLLFTVLDHYNYDVAMLCSEMFKHSVIAVNLPYPGISKIINGRPYVVWETTAKGIRPGLFPPDISDMRYWTVILTSNANHT